MRLWLYLFLLCLLLACQAEEKPPTALAEVEGPAYSRVPSRLGLIHEMQGRWKDAKIKDAELLISGNKFISIYKDEIRSQAKIQAFTKCPEACPQGKKSQAKGFFIVYREEGAECYTLDKLGNGVMEYTLVEGGSWEF